MTDQIPDVELRLREAAAVLRPDLADEISRLYAIEAAHAQLVANARGAEELHDQTRALVGHLRERLLRAERGLETLPAATIAEARRTALLVGDAYIRVRRVVDDERRGHFEELVVPAEQVVIHARE